MLPSGIRLLAPMPGTTSSITLYPGLEKKGIDIGSNFNWNNTIMWILIGLVVIAGVIGISKWWKQRQKKNEMRNVSTQ